jgi:hypothetical protein
MSGSYTLDDNFFKNNVNAPQVAALLFLETLTIWKYYLVDYYATYASSIATKNSNCPNYSNYSIDLRINTVSKIASSTKNLFTIDFEQDVKDDSSNTTSLNLHQLHSYSDETNNFFNDGKYTPTYYETTYTCVSVDLDIPSAVYLGTNISIDKIFSTSTLSTSDAYPSLSTNHSTSYPLVEDGDTISGNLNSF